jgi:molybdate transport system substrate-binding protein
MPDELRLMSARAVKSAVSALAEKFTQQTGCAVDFDFAPVGTLEKKLAAGERTDALILSLSAIEKVDTAGLIDSHSRRALGRTSIGVAVREGARLPDISTPEAFTALLLSVKKISVSDVAVGGTAAVYLPQLFVRMGIAEAIESKLVRCTGGGDVTERVARGEATIGMTFISEILAIKGATVVGPLPVPYGNDTAYVAAVMKMANAPDVASAFIAALIGPQTGSTWRAAGFDVPVILQT